MSIAGVVDKVARKVMELPSAGHVYGDGSTDDQVPPYPAETIDNDVHALVGRGQTALSGGTGNQRLAADIDVLWRFPAIDRGEAARLIDRIEEEMILEFASGITLGGSVIQSYYRGSTAPFDFEDEAGRRWIAWVAHVAVQLRYSIEMTP